MASKLIKKNKDLIKFSSKLRKKILDLSFFAGASSSHFGGALSSVEILATLFGKVLDFNKYNYDIVFKAIAFEKYDKESNSVKTLDVTKFCKNFPQAQFTSLKSGLLDMVKSLKLA